MSGAAAAEPQPGAAAAAQPGAAQPAGQAAEPGAAAASGEILDTSAAIPEKFVVKREDGSLDYEAIARKVLPSYLSLEKRIGTGELPPEKEDGYTLDWSKFENKLDPEREKSLLKRAHGRRMTNKQLQGTLDDFAELAKEAKTMQLQSVEQSFNTARAELATAWGDSFEANKENVNAAFKALADEEMIADAPKLGKDAAATYKALMKVLAKVGVDYQPDRPPAGGPVTAESISELKASEAFRKADHPQHEETVKKVSELEHRLYAKKK